MKKIMFNDRFGLTEAVIEKRKTVTRRLVSPRKVITSENIGYSALTPDNHIEIRGYHENGEYGSSFFKKPYKVGEIVAVAQKYSSFIKAVDWDAIDSLAHTKGWTNKMFVKAEYMPHQIRILDVRAEKLQDITDEDCLREGVYKDECKTYFNGYAFDLTRCEGNCILATQWYKSPREAFAALIDKISGKGTWKSNPFVWRIEFELLTNKT